MLDSRPRRALVLLLAACLPFLLLGGVEVALRRIPSFRAGQALFTPVEGHPGYQVLNPAYFSKFFNDGFTPTVAYQPFQAEKNPGTFRVMVLGGSSAAGYPYRYYLGFPTRLEQLLEAHAAGQAVEVLNLGVSAVSSYMLWDMAGALLRYEPDAIVFYAGHNEYYGAYGAGSTMSPAVERVALKRLVIRLKRWALVRGLERLLGAAAGAAARAAGDGGRGTLMERVVRDAAIERDGAVYEAGVAQFAANLDAILDVFERAGVPVYAGTLVSNLKDQPPFGDAPEARAAFETGHARFVAGDLQGARVAFREAREADGIRFRAPAAMNDLLRAQAAAGRLTLVDLEAVAAAHSESGIEDATFFDDHLHPNDRGYAALAGAFFDVLKAHPAVRPAGPGQTSAAPLRLDAFERAHAFLQVFRLRVGFPFDTTATREEQRYRLRGMLEQYRRSGFYLDRLTYRTMMEPSAVEEVVREAVAEARARGDTSTALHLYRSLLYLAPFDAALADKAVAYASSVAGTAYVPLQEDLLFHALNRAADAQARRACLEGLATLRRRLGHTQAAEAFDALVETRPLLIPR